jgi:hypothetical protein
MIFFPVLESICLKGLKQTTKKGWSAMCVYLEADFSAKIKKPILLVKGFNCRKNRTKSWQKYKNGIEKDKGLFKPSPVVLINTWRTWDITS